MPEEAGGAQAMFLWAFATLRERMGSACLGALAAQARECLPRFTSMDVADMLWAFAKLGHIFEDALLQDCEAHVTHISSTFTPQQLVRCCMCTGNKLKCHTISAHVCAD